MDFYQLGEVGQFKDTAYSGELLLLIITDIIMRTIYPADYMAW